MSNMQSSFCRFFNFAFLSFTVALLIILASNNPAFYGEIHDAAKRGDLGKVKISLKDNPDLVTSKDEDGELPLHLAVLKGHKDVAEFLRQHGGHE